MNTCQPNQSNQVAVQTANSTAATPPNLQICASNPQIAHFDPPPPLHLRPNNPLSALNHAQLDQLYDWLLTADLQTAQKNCFAQFELRIGISALSRYRKRRKQYERLHDAAQAGANTPGQLHQTAAASFAHLLLETADEGAAQDFSRLAAWFAKHEYNQIQSQFLEVAQTQTRLARDRLTLATQQFQFNAARQVMKHLLELLRIHNLPDLDDEDKIWKASQLIFQTQTQTEK